MTRAELVEYLHRCVEFAPSRVSSPLPEPDGLSYAVGDAVEPKLYLTFGDDEFVVEVTQHTRIPRQGG